MIDFDRLRQVIEKMAEATTPLKIVRAGQNGPRPAYPLATYKVMQLNGWQPHQYFTSDALKEGDATTIVVSKFETLKVTISLNFSDFGKPDAIWAAAKKAKDWLTSTAGEEFCETLEIVPRILGDINDRSAFMETDNELRIGFDIRLDCDNVTTEELEAMSKVVINGNEITPAPQP